MTHQTVNWRTKENPDLSSLSHQQDDTRTKQRVWDQMSNRDAWLWNELCLLTLLMQYFWQNYYKGCLNLIYLQLSNSLDQYICAIAAKWLNFTETVRNCQRKSSIKQEKKSLFRLLQQGQIS